MQIGYDFNAAINQINNCPAIATSTFQLGRHSVTLEQVTTIWHMTWNGTADYVFRVAIDGRPCLGIRGERDFVRPVSGVHRQILGPKVFASKPDWLPKDVTKATANKAFDAAMLSLLARGA